MHSYFKLLYLNLSKFNMSFIEYTLLFIAFIANHVIWLAFKFEISYLIGICFMISSNCIIQLMIS